MIRRSFRIGLWLGLLAGIGFALAKIFRPKPEPAGVLDLGTSTGTGAREWPPLDTAGPTRTPAPTPIPTVAPAPVSAPESEPALEPEVAPAAAKKPAVKKVAAKKAPEKKTLPPWVDPDGNVCPETHPVKGKLSSKIFQVEGNFAYWRTNPDRCYESADAAIDDGLRPAKR